MLGPLLLNLFINDLKFFIKETEVCNFTDDTNLYSCSLNFEEAHRKLSSDTLIVLNWFRINSIVANPGKFQIMFLKSSINNNNFTFMVENIKSNNEVKHLRITIDHKVNFTKHINNLCNTESNFLRALTSKRKFLSQEQTKRLSEAYIKCQLSNTVLLCGCSEVKLKTIN